ncbi:MAG: CDP-alcohol phosphatidyltransferase family protein [Rubricoccaceae bacterium]|nr:CDP-alcohol phosphatidyltransferase family protein [Rubricoccaceae bacterium]
MGRFWTAANALSLARVVLVVPITWMVYQGGPIGPMFGLIGLAIATDFFDGRVARWSHTVSEWGKVLDASADKIAAASVTVALLIRPTPPNLPLWFVALAVSRDAILTIGGLIQSYRLGKFTTSLWSGKVAVTALAVSVVAALLGARPTVLEACVWCTSAIMVYSIIEYAIRFREIMRADAHIDLDEDGNVILNH